MRRAFTLVELLVVVAIITLLVAIFAPVNRSLIIRGRFIVCQSNLHHLGMAVQNYCGTHRRSPSAWFNAGGAWYAGWPGQLLTHSGYQRKMFWCPAEDAIAQWIPTFGSPPAGSTGYGYEPGEMPILSGPNGAYFSYGFNDWGSQEVGSPGNPASGYLGFHEIPLASIREPGRFIELADSSTDKCWDTILDPKDDQYGLTESPGRRHYDGCNTVMGDGHVEWMLYSTITNVYDPEVRRLWNNDNEPHGHN